MYDIKGLGKKKLEAPVVVLNFSQNELIYSKTLKALSSILLLDLTLNRIFFFALDINFGEVVTSTVLKDQMSAKKILGNSPKRDVSFKDFNNVWKTTSMLDSRLYGYR